MSTRTTLIIGLVFILLAVALSAAVYNRLPERVAERHGGDEGDNGGWPNPMIAKQFANGKGEFDRSLQTRSRPERMLDFLH